MAGFTSNINASTSFQTGVVHRVVTVWQEAKYRHNARNHYANARMNNYYSGWVWAGRGKVAHAKSPWVYTVNWVNNNGYYGW